MAELPDNPDELEIVIYPHPALRETAEPVEDPTDPRVRPLVERMRKLMMDGNGVGLAATQVNVKARLFLANPTREPGDEVVMINPEVVESEGWQQTEEGCLSIPEVTCRLRRRQRVKVRYQDLDGQSRELDATDFLACIIQHESDHLVGRLIIDRVGVAGRMNIREQLSRLESRFESSRQTAGR